MFEVLGQMAALVACGMGWRAFRPLGLAADTTRSVLTGLVYVLLLPALVLQVLWRTPLGLDSLRIAALGSGTMVGALLLTWWVCRLARVKRPTAGALVLAVAFPNVLYLGLPVLEATFGNWSRGVAVQIDLFAMEPVLFTLGVAAAQAHGHGGDGIHPVAALAKVPPLWAGLLGALLNVTGVAMPHWIQGLLGMLASGVIPLMLLSLGLSLSWSQVHRDNLPLVIPAVIARLLLIPLGAWYLSGPLGLAGSERVAAVLETAMPSMVLGLMLCDRYRLNTGLYAMTVTLSTVFSLVTLPLWLDWLGHGR